MDKAREQHNVLMDKGREQLTAFGVSCYIDGMEYGGSTEHNRCLDVKYSVAYNQGITTDDLIVC